MFLVIIRPTAEEVLSHCLFWPEKKQLAFFQDVSDRIEKENYSSAIVQALEQGASSVCRGDWRNNITDELKEGAYIYHLVLIIIRQYLSLFLYLKLMSPP